MNKFEASKLDWLAVSDSSRREMLSENPIDTIVNY